MLNQRSVLLGKIESAYATDPTPTGSSNALLVQNLSWAPANASMYERPVVRVSQAKLKPLFGRTLYEVKFDVEAKGSGSAGVAPAIGPFLRACGMAETIVPSTSVTYKPASSGAPSMYFYCYKDGKLVKLAGGMGRLTGVVQVGNVPIFSFSFICHLVSEADAALPATTLESTVPVVAVNVPFVMDSVSTFALTKFDFDLGVEVATPDNIVAADGFGQFQITSRKVTASIDPEDLLVATYDYLTKWKGSTAFALTTGVIGSTAGNRLQITLPAVSITDQGYGDKSGIVTRPLKLAAAESSGDDEISIIFT